jgi:uncharacterized RDD family membrane protein YckC
MENGMKNHAGFLIRAKAFLFDYAGILLYLGFVTGLFILLNLTMDVSQILFGDRFTGQFSGLMTVTLPVVLYFALSESSSRQATWGKSRMRLKVVTLSGGRIGFWRSLARALLKFAPWELAHTLIWEVRFTTGLDPAMINIGLALVYALIGLNLASLALSKKKQTLYDLLAGTYVIGSD